MRIGPITLEQPLLLAPMEDVTDVAFRLICKRNGADVVYTEFVNAEGLVRDSMSTLRKLTILDEERPIGIQIYGAEIPSMVRAASIAEGASPELIDINAGCWVKDVALRGAGAGLLRDPDKMEAMVRAVVQAVSLPVTMKTRLGWDESSINIVDIAKRVEAAGAAALTIHCRTRTQGLRGVVNYSHIPEVKRAVSIPVFVNGDVRTPEDAKRVFEETGCDGVMIGRGAIENPWLFQQTKYFLTTGNKLPPPTLNERVRLFLEHVGLSVSLKGERKGVIELRKHFSGYLHGIPNVARFRSELMTIVDRQQLTERLLEFRDRTEPVGTPLS
jgi:tRNA-dihydrouridine synthase B